MYKKMVHKNLTSQKVHPIFLILSQILVIRKNISIKVHQILPFKSNSIEFHNANKIQCKSNFTIMSQNLKFEPRKTSSRTALFRSQKVTLKLTSNVQNPLIKLKKCVENSYKLQTFPESNKFIDAFDLKRAPGWNILQSTEIRRVLLVALAILKLSSI